MEFSGLKNFITCHICVELFDDVNRCPRILLCGHTFCHSCLEKILLQNHLCPTCKSVIDVFEAKLIPTNYIVKSMTDAYKQSVPYELQNNPDTTRKLEAVGFCAEHSRTKEFRCMNCECYICNICAVLIHKSCNIVLIKEANKVLKGQLSLRLKKEEDPWKIFNNNGKLALQSLEQQRNSLEEKIKKNSISLKECEKNIRDLQFLQSNFLHSCNILKDLETSLETSSDDNVFSRNMDKFDLTMIQTRKLLLQLDTFQIISSKADFTIEYIKKMTEMNNDVGVSSGNLYGRVTVVKGQIWITSLQPMKSKVFLFSFDELLRKHNGVPGLPGNAFLKLVPEGGGKEVVIVIETDGTSRRAKNFLECCLALKNITYKGSSLYRSHVSCELGEGPSPDLSRSVLNCPNVGNVSGRMNWENHFDITLLANRCVPGDGPLITDFGRVISGLKELRGLPVGKLTVKECGLVIP